MSGDIRQRERRSIYELNGDRRGDEEKNQGEGERNGEESLRVTVVIEPICTSSTLVGYCICSSLDDTQLHCTVPFWLTPSPATKPDSSSVL
ncbi:hypothetical protein F2P81_001486 [Scophthalmus maximus]|uniref:Uncharacterized protein n=1 Tax=Scophthalmus maximus TaxID=52904 RepID=A0A6A4TEC6_SCOMX|nr:hypothetical protein F2P81_001486 [Scophthalmus maximus]